MLVGPALYLLSRADARHDARPGPATAVVALDDDPGVAVDLPALELHEASGA
jgi:hypothetical protein